ncbi:(d)CMP kinase [Cellulosilyticum sp. I15G10I2]|uniref:(d)CMP kinase n=1 Tax=Cellulosilyticum sp. I15G10I2 TaxID=1892843 RepID=UPI00085CDDA9|nr:(d)CMP kinase [Cellulosilyticum sp. I15G10I2]
MKKISIAIDGPAGAGKSTIAKVLAKRIGCIYIDTGAMYRAVGLYCIQNNIDYYDEKAVNSVISELQIDIYAQDNQQAIYLNGRDISREIRTDEVAAAASKVATYKEVRTALVRQQRQMQSEKSVVMDGRDIGTVVMPDATLKVFLTASVVERAKRRFEEYHNKGVNVTLEELTQEIIERDYQDSNREISPLKKADDAVEIDTTLLGIDEIVDKIMSFIIEH